MSGDHHYVVLPDGSREEIPEAVYPIPSDNGGWCRRDPAPEATVEAASAWLARAERQATDAVARRDYLRGLMLRVLNAEWKRVEDEKACQRHEGVTA